MIRTDDGYYDLSPAYDVVPSAQDLGQQQLWVGQHGTEASIENALSEVRAFGLNKDAAIEVVRRVGKVIDGWQNHFLECGVSKRDIEQLGQYIDGPRADGPARRVGALMGISGWTGALCCV